MKPLPFQAGSLNGLSERLIQSHHENNYAGAVKNLNRVEVELSQLTKDTPPFVVGALKERELTFKNSATLHELYFGNLGGDGKATGRIERALTEAHGSLSGWEAHFRAVGLALGGGSGWAVLAYDLHRGAVTTFSGGGHPTTMALAAPLLVLDMFEHAYAIDYGAAAAKYLAAFLANVQWDVVNARLERAEKAAAALRV